MKTMGIVHIVDMVIGISLLFSIWMGYRRGLVVTVARIAAMVVSYLGAVLVAGACKEVVASKIILPLLFTVQHSLAALSGDAATAVAERIAYAAVFALAFAVLELALTFLISLLKLVDRIPVIGLLDRLGGAIFGFLWVFLFCLVLGNVFFSYVPAKLRHQWGFTEKAVRDTILLNVFMEDPGE